MILSRLWPPSSVPRATALSALLVLTLLLRLPGEVSAATTPFLKEILQGRCYDHNPTGSIDDCPSLVGGFMGVIEGHLDSQITPDHFESTLDQLQLAPPNDQALLIVRGGQSDSPQDRAGVDTSWSSQDSPKGLMSPEDTAGGSFLEGLVFCGTDQAQNCDKEKSNAYWTLWETLCAHYARQIEGHLQILVLDNESIDWQFVERSFVNHMDVDAITEITLFGADCSNPSTPTGKAQTIFEEVLGQPVSCIDDYATFRLCAASESSIECLRYKNQTMACSRDAPQGKTLPPEEEPNEASDDSERESLPASDSSEEDEPSFNPPDKPKRHHKFFYFILLVIIFAIGLWVHQHALGGTKIFGSDFCGGNYFASSLGKESFNGSSQGERSALIPTNGKAAVDTEAAHAAFLNANRNQGDMETVVVQ